MCIVIVGKYTLRESQTWVIHPLAPMEHTGIGHFFWPKTNDPPEKMNNYRAWNGANQNGYTPEN